MSIDPYTICPGGCNKKIKFCCGKDVSVSVDKIVTALSGEQRLSALDLCNSALEQHGNKACLLALKTNIQFQLGELEQARETTKAYLTDYPDNSVALAMDTIGRLAAHETVTEEELNSIVEQLQRSLENLEQIGVSVVLEAVRRVGLALYSTGRLPAARAHWMLYNGFLEEPDEEISRMMMQSFSSPEIPLLLRYDHLIPPCEEENEWSDEYNKTIEATMTGRWLSAIEELTDLDKKHPNQPMIAKAIAVLESRLGDSAEIAAAWSQYADTDGVPTDEAVEAEALSQLIDPTIEEDGIDIVETAYPVTDLEKLMEVIAAESRIERIDVDLNQFADGGPAPKGAYALLDCEMPESHENLTADTIPNVIGQMLVFGKQTDREATLKSIVTRDEKFGDNQQALLSIAGDCLNASDASEEVIDAISPLSHALTWNWRFPPGTPNEFRSEMIRDRRRQILMDVWPELPLAELDDKSPREASTLDNYRIPVLGAILLLELSEATTRTETTDLNPLREKLGLPTRDPVDPSSIEDIGRISLPQLEKLEVEKLDDEQLTEVFHLVGMFGVDRPLRSVCEQLLARESFKDHEEIDLSRIYAILSRLEPDAEKAFDHIHKARDMTIDAGEPVGNILVAELELRMERGVLDKVQPLLKEIEMRHMREPGVSQNLMRVLMRFGIIGPDGRPRGPMPGQGQPGELEPAAAAADSGKSELWTPESESAGGGESKLWVPGDD